MGRPRTPIRVAHRAGLTLLTNIAPAGSGGRLMPEGEPSFLRQPAR